MKINERVVCISPMRYGVKVSMYLVSPLLIRRATALDDIAVRIDRNGASHTGVFLCFDERVANFSRIRRIRAPDRIDQDTGSIECQRCKRIGNLTVTPLVLNDKL
jgi:hypothetical protein